MSIASETVPHWYVIHTYTGYENKVAANIQKIVENRGVSHLVHAVKIPTEKVIEVTDKDKKEVERKVFPSYVLVKMIMNDESWHIIRNTTGVTGFVGPGSVPVALTDAEVEKLGVEIKVIEIKYAVGDSVKICDGPLKGFIGLVESISEDKTMVTVSASLFGRETKVELKADQAQPLDQ